MYFKLLCMLSIATSAFALPHAITIYSEYNQKGATVTFDSKERNLVPWRHFLESAKSYCVLTQSWYAHMEVDFESSHYELTEGCRNFTSFASVSSMRHLGPRDTNITALSLYSGSGPSLVGGDELIIEEPGANNFGFMPMFFLLTGGMDWTVYSENNFTGMSHCFSSGGVNYIGFNYRDVVFTVQSVKKGCIL